MGWFFKDKPKKADPHNYDEGNYWGRDPKHVRKRDKEDKDLKGYYSKGRGKGDYRSRK